MLNEVDTNKTALERIKIMVEIRDVTRAILDMQVEGCTNEKLEQKQAELNTSYDKYHKKFGTISSMGSSRAFRDDSSYPLLRSLENIDDEGNVTYVTNSDETSLAQTKQEELENQFSNRIFADAYKLYPNVKILVATKKGF